MHPCTLGATCCFLTDKVGGGLEQSGCCPEIKSTPAPPPKATVFSHSQGRRLQGVELRSWEKLGEASRSQG